MYFLISNSKSHRLFVIAIEILRKVLKNNKQKLRSLSLLFPNLFIVVLTIWNGYTHYYREKPALIMLLVGLEFFLMSAKIIVATICKMNFGAGHIEPFILLIPLIGTWLKIDENWLYLGTLIAIGVRALAYVARVINEMANSLGINCFCIKKKDEILDEERKK